MSPRRRENVTLSLIGLEYGSRSVNPYRVASATLATLISAGRREFRKVAEYKCKKKMVYENKTLVEADLLKAHTGYGPNLRPCLAFDVKRCQKFHRLKNFSFIHIKPLQVPLPLQQHRSCLMAVAQGNWFLHISQQTGRVLQSVRLLASEAVYHFNEVDSSGDYAEVVLRASPNLAARNRGGAPSPRVAAFALFNVAPLQFVGMFEVTREVFGSTLLSVETHTDILCACHKRNLIHIHSLQHIVENFLVEPVKLGERVPSTGRMCGVDMDGLPFNILITREPPVLFRVPDSSASLQIGGNPWHCLVSSAKNQNTMRCYSLENGSPVEGDVAFIQEEPEDYSFFLGDEMARLVNIHRKQISVYRICDGSKPGSHGLERLFSFRLDDMYSPSLVRPFQVPVVTASGREVMRNRIYEWASPVHMPKIGYEDELDLLYTTFSMVDNDRCYSTVTFYDNLTGQRLFHAELTKRQPSCKESCIQQTATDEDIIVDMDTVYISRHDVSTTSEIFRLFEPFDSENVPITDDSSASQRRHAARRRRSASGNRRPGRSRGNRGVSRNRHRRNRNRRREYNSDSSSSLTDEESP